MDLDFSVLTQIAKSNDDGNISRDFTPILRCDRCMGKDLVYCVHYNKEQHSVRLMVYCNECGKHIFIPSKENLRRRSNTPLEKWSNNVKLRDEGKCRICGDTKYVEAHHIIPVRNDPDGKYKYDINNGITLCKACHGLVHKQ